MIQSILVDDESDNLEELQDCLKKYCPEVTVLGAYTDPVKACELIRLQKPELVFLDVQMPGMSGFELLQKLSPSSFEVIFVSAYDRYAVKAIKFSALDYLLKPIDVDDLTHAVARVKERLDHSSNNFSLQSVLHNVQHNSGVIDRIAIPSTEGIDFFETKDIIFCKAEDCYTTLYFTDQPSIVASRTLKDFENLLTESGFCRVHNSFLINLRHVKKYVRGEGGYVVLTGDHHVDISRRRKEEFLSMLNRL